MRRVEGGGVVLCIVPQEGEEPRRTPMPHYSWTDQEATLVQTASFSSVPRGEKTNKKQTKKKAKTSAGEYFSDGPVKQSPRTCCALPRSPRGYTSRLSLFHILLYRAKKKKWSVWLQEGRSRSDTTRGASPQSSSSSSSLPARHAGLTSFSTQS